MKKYTKRLLLSAAITAIASSAALASGAPILTAVTITPHNQEIQINEAKTLVGKKTASGSCAANQIYRDDRFEYDMFQLPGTEYMTSSDIQFGIGPAKDCFKVEIIRNGNTYSTGNINLTWNQSTNEYVAANPSTATINIKK